MERALQEGHVPEGLAEPGGRRVALQPAAPLRQQVEHAIREAIINGQFRPGQRLTGATLRDAATGRTTRLLGLVLSASTNPLNARLTMALEERAHELGYDRFSMNFAAWGRFFEEDVEYSLGQRAVKLLLDTCTFLWAVRADGRLSERWRCFFREWIGWIPLAVVLLAALAFTRPYVMDRFKTFIQS